MMTDKLSLFNQDGYLIECSAWNHELAQTIAEQEAIELTDAHWVFFDFIRTYYQEHQDMPKTRLIVKHLRNHLQDETLSNAFLYELFPKSPLRQGCKIAGLPKPKRCL